MSGAVGHDDRAGFVDDDQHQRQPVGEVLITKGGRLFIAIRRSDKLVIIGDWDKHVRFAAMMGNEYRLAGLAQMTELTRKFRCADKNFLQSAIPVAT